MSGSAQEPFQLSFQQAHQQNQFVDKEPFILDTRQWKTHTYLEWQHPQQTLAGRIKGHAWIAALDVRGQHKLFVGSFNMEWKCVGGLEAARSPSQLTPWSENVNHVVAWASFNSSKQAWRERLGNKSNRLLCSPGLCQMPWEAPRPS